MKKQWNTVLMIGLILLVVIFSVLNVDPVNINFGFTTVGIPLVVVIIGTLLIGVLIAVVWSTSLLLKERNQQKKLQKKLDTFKEDASAEQSSIQKDHQEEIDALNQKLEEKETRIRELNRRIENMKSDQQH